MLIFRALLLWGLKAHLYCLIRFFPTFARAFLFMIRLLYTLRKFPQTVPSDLPPPYAKSRGLS